MSERRSRAPRTPRTTRPGSETPRRAGPPVRPRRISRREREARQRRRLYVGLGIVGALIVVILAFALTNENVIKPRTVLASVNETEIQRQDYWRYQGVQLIEQVNQFSRLAGLVSSDQAGQYRQAAAQAQADFNNLWGSTDVDDAVLQQMIDDQVFVQNLGELGLSISDDELDTFILNRFAPDEAPLLPETPSPTLIPTRAAWATETAAADPNAQPPIDGSPAAGTPESTGALPATPLAENASPESAASPQPGMDGSPTVASTPNATEAVATAQANYALYRDNVFDRANISRDQYRRWVARPQLAREKATSAISSDVGQQAEQVQASHILVETQELAQQIRADLEQPGADFAQIAMSQSTDTASATNGGDLGWFTRGEMVAPFEDAAFALQPGEISQPVQSDFGWHIISVRDHAQDRPMSDEQIQLAQQRVVEQWLEEQKAEADIDSDINPTATAAPSVFEPPANAPPAVPPDAEAPAQPAPTSAPLPAQPGS